MTTAIIHNVLLRIDGLAGEPPFPFERPRYDLDFWVLELPVQNPCMADWSARTIQVLRDQAPLLRRMHLAGGRSSLFVELTADIAVFRLDADLLKLLGELGTALECAHATSE